MNRPRQLHAEPPAKHRHRTSPASRRRSSCPACAVHAVVGSGRGPPVQPDWFKSCLVLLMMMMHRLVLSRRGWTVEMLFARRKATQPRSHRGGEHQYVQAKRDLSIGDVVCVHGVPQKKPRSRSLLATAEFGTTTCLLLLPTWSFAPAFPTTLLTHCTPRPPHKHQAHLLHRNHELRTYL